MVDDDLWALIEPLLPLWPEKAPGPRPVPDQLCLQGILHVLHNDILTTPAPGTGVRLGPDLLAAAGTVAAAAGRADVGAPVTETP